MSDAEYCQLTTKDYSIVETMLEHYQCRDATISAILRRKISSALVMFRDEIPPSVVTLSSRVAYRTNDGPIETRIVAHDAMRGLIGMLLPITNPRGLALLGLAEGQTITIPKADGTFETLTVQEVVYQPEAAKRERMNLANAATPDLSQRRGPSRIRLGNRTE